MICSIIELAPTRPLRLEILGAMPDRDPAIQAAWNDAARQNPRLFDGPILAVQTVDPASNTIRATPERFAHVVCSRDWTTLTTTILSVTGIIEANRGGQPCILVARRGPSTRSYPGMWEFAPAGGLHPVANTSVLGLNHVLRTLRAELLEEVGIDVPLQNVQPIAVVADPTARSMDIAVRAQLPGEAPKPRIQGEHAWECSEATWVPISEVARFLLSAPGGAIEPTVALARWLGWL